MISVSIVVALALVAAGAGLGNVRRLMNADKVPSQTDDNEMHQLRRENDRLEHRLRSLTDGRNDLRSELADLKQQLDELEGHNVETTPELPGGSVGEDFDPTYIAPANDIGGSYVSPDPATVREFVIHGYADLLKRSPQDWELEEMATLLAQLLEAEWEAHGRGEPFDAIARFQQAMRERYGPEIRTRADLN